MTDAETAQTIEEARVWVKADHFETPIVVEMLEIIDDQSKKLREQAAEIERRRKLHTVLELYMADKIVLRTLRDAISEFEGWPNAENIVSAPDEGK